MPVPERTNPHLFSGPAALAALVFCSFLFLAMNACTGPAESGSDNRKTDTSSSPSIPDYPVWFLQPGTFEKEAVTGFAMSSFFEARAVDRAASDAARTKKAYRGLGIAYTTFWEQLPDDSFRLTGEEFLTDTLSSARPDYHLMDFATVGRMTIAAISATDAITLPKQRIPPGPRPAWVQSPPKSSNGYIFAVGYSPVYYYEHESWKQAEISALKSLAQDVEIRHQRLVRSLNGASEAITLQESRIVTGPILVKYRWRDLRNSYVLIKTSARAR